MEIQRVTNKGQIVSLLYQFECVFPHLHEKVQNYDEYAEKLAKHAVIGIMKDKQDTCGLIVFYANDIQNLTAFISLIGVLPAWQGKHLGQQLLEYSISEAISAGMQSLRLEVDLDNQRAIAFYERCGFDYSGTCTPTSIYMEKTLLVNSDSFY